MFPFSKLELRRLLTVSYSINANTLTVQGDASPNTIVVDQLSPFSFGLYLDGSSTTVTSTNAIKNIKINGSGGDDVLMALPSVSLATTLLGGAGNDQMSGGLGRDKFDGGTGEEDEVSYESYHGNLRLSANGVADDGLFAERDNILATVENIVGGSGNDLIIGTTAWAGVLMGGPGNDAIWAGPYGDLLIGGEGNDSMHGGGGDDYLAGNSGADQLFGDAGNDVLESNDTEVDNLVGGAGADTAYVDSIDNWAADIESVNFVF